MGVREWSRGSLGRGLWFVRTPMRREGTYRYLGKVPLIIAS